MTKCAVLPGCLTVIITDPVEKKTHTNKAKKGQKVVWKGPAEIDISKCVSSQSSEKMKRSNCPLFPKTLIDCKRLLFVLLHNRVHVCKGQLL